VLVIDDDPAVRKVLGAMAESQGFSPLLAGGGDEGVRLYARHRGAVAAVVLDVQMSGKDGPQTLGELRALDPALPCVFVTGFSPNYSYADLAGRGAVVLSKPLASGELGRALRAATGGAGKVVVADPDGTAETLPETPPLPPG
jgi:two-component system cell cycle sensor histidine kinase/response regulator CckA